jgi:hypothetical protein
MSTIGFDLQKGFLRYSVLDGTKSNPLLISKEKLSILRTNSEPQMMNWFDSTFRAVLGRSNPDSIAYRLSLEPNLAQIPYLIYPWAILCLVAHSLGIPVTCYSSKGVTPAKLGLAKHTDLYTHCDNVFGANPPYWDRNQKNSVLVAWFTLS